MAVMDIHCLAWARRFLKEELHETISLCHRPVQRSDRRLRRWIVRFFDRTGHGAGGAGGCGTGTSASAGYRGNARAGRGRTSASASSSTSTCGDARAGCRDACTGAGAGSSTGSCSRSCFCSCSCSCSCSGSSSSSGFDSCPSDRSNTHARGMFQADAGREVRRYVWQHASGEQCGF